MHHLLKLFNSGQYKPVYNNLLKQQLEQENVGNQLTQQLLQENNIAVCISLMRESHTHGSNNESVNFVSILKKCYSIPGNKQCLILELTLLYNIIYNELVCDKLDEDLQCYNYIYRTCHRVLVCTNIGQKTKKSDFLNYSDVRVAVWSSIQKCLTVLQLQTDTGLQEAFLWLALILCVKEIKNNQCAIVKQCLSDIHKIVTKGQVTLDNKDTDSLMLRLPLCIDHVELNSLNTSEVFQHVSSLLLSVCLTDTKSWDEIVKLLDTNINGGSAKSVSQFYLGFAFYKQDRFTDSVSCLMEVLRCTDSMTQRLKARVCNLIGQCFMKLDKSHLSVQMFKEALCADFSYLLPLYNTSLQYGQQGMDNLELECLNLLSTALEMRSSSPTKDSRVDLLSLLDTEDADVQYEFVLYALAYRTLQLERYDVSSEKYMQLIEHLKTRNGCLTDKSRIPSVVQIHHEAIESLFKSEKFTECVNLCDKLILCYHGNQTVLLSQTLDQSFLSQSQINWNDSLTIEQSCTPVALNNTLTGSQTENQSFSHSRNQSFSQTGTQSGKKRKHCEITESQTDDDGGNIDIVALRYKAECLHKMGDSTTALSCLQSALDSITSSRRRKLHQCMNKITDSVSLEPNSKKQKTGSTTSLVQDSEVLPHSKTNNNVVDILDDSLESLKLERILYEKTAEILTSLKQTKDAQHFSRLAEQIKFVEQKKG